MQTFIWTVENWFWEFLPKLGLAIVILILSHYFSQLFAKLIKKILSKREVDIGVTNLSHDITRWTIMTAGVITALQQFVDITAFLAGLGILGFTVGFALQETMKNFAAGILLLVQKPFRIGDTISVQGFDGTVVKIDLRSTEIIDLNGRVVILPNSEVLNHAIINFTRSIKRRIQIPVGVAYGSDLTKVYEVTMQAIQAMPITLADPAPQVVFSLFNASSIDIVIYFWIDTSVITVFAAQDQAVKQIKQAYDSHQIEIPFKTQTLLVKNE